MQAYVMTLCFALAATAGSVSARYLSDTHWESEAIKRGYALHCPRNGEFAWKGECEEGE